MVTSGLDASLQRALTHLKSIQRADGSWNGDNFAGPVYTALMLILESYLGILSDLDKAEGAKWILSQQYDDGSYPEFLNAPQGALEPTATCYCALLLCGYSVELPEMQKAKAFVDEQGGYAKCNLLYLIYICMAGEYPASKLPSMTLLWKLVPFSKRILAFRFGLQMAIVANELPLAIQGLKRGGKAPKWYRCPLLTFQWWRVRRYLLKRQNPEGNWMGILMPSLLALVCLKYTGSSLADRYYAKGISYLSHWKVYSERGLRVIPYASEVWNTALITRLFLEQGDKVTEAPLRASLNYLYRQQSMAIEPADWQNPTWNTPRFGGWPYEQGNPLCSDTDTTGAVLWTLGLAKKSGEDGPVISAAVDKATAWEWGMQNKDGGWAAFARGHKSKPPGAIMTKPFNFPAPTMLNMLKMFFNPPLALGDPSTAGLTGRVLSAMGMLGYDKRHPSIASAIAFLKYQADERGIWWGRWEVNFLQASACVISGLWAVGEDMQAGYVQKALDWMLSKQQEDGSWGEGNETYYDPSKAGEGASSATVTGAVISALIDAGLASSDNVSRGIEYLVRTQSEDGTWPEPLPLFVMVAPNSFYTNTVYSQYSPVEALIKYRRIAAE
jgi:squalene-hopene/tetraprenyl-beta-curcumene cyclase